ncbi:MAG: hypothetical protein PWP23_1405 [Candidatus Sumerlaeota bacterium]|nr:hypothetical protein [Candidatus Sumerlaeota bacterium]
MKLTANPEAIAFAAELAGCSLPLPGDTSPAGATPRRRATLSRYLLLALLPLLFLLFGCAGKLKPTGYLPDYTEFNRYQDENFGMRIRENQDRSIDQYFLTREDIAALEKNGEPVPMLADIGITEEDVQPVLFIVPPAEWRASWEPESEEEKEALLFTIRERFYRYLLRRYPHPVRVRYAYVPDEPAVLGYRVLEVQTAITDVNPGVGWLRYVIGYGAGTTAIQIEGRIQEEDTTLAEFAIREAHAGYPNGFINTRVFNSTYCLRYAAEEAINNLSNYFRTTIPAARLREGVTAAGMAATQPIELQ